MSEDDEKVYCCRCSGSTHITWCPSYGDYFCAQCKWVRTEQELNPPGVVSPLVMSGGVPVVAECL